MRYISVYLWLPVSDLFSSILARIQVLMLKNDIIRMQQDPNFSLDSSDAVYIIFMIIGIIGYFTIPTVAGWVVQAGGGGALSRGINAVAMKGAAAGGAFAGAAAGNMAGTAGAGISAGGRKLKQGAGALVRRIKNRKQNQGNNNNS